MKVRNQVNYAVIPEWILYADVSAQAIRLYGFLHRHATRRGKGYCSPTRRQLTEEMRVKNPKTVDRALDELEKVGAIEVEYNQRVKALGQVANSYVVRSTPKGEGEQVSIPLDTDVEGGRDTEVEGPLDTDVQPKDKSSTSTKSSKDLSTSSPNGDFTLLWKHYPPNAKGIKPDKQLALRQWNKLSAEDRELALVGVAHYADGCKDGTYVKHAHRWLRDRTFEAYQVPPRASPNGTKPDRFRGIDAKWERTEE